MTPAFRSQLLTVNGPTLYPKLGSNAGEPDKVDYLDVTIKQDQPWMAV